MTGRRTLCAVCEGCGPAVSGLSIRQGLAAIFNLVPKRNRCPPRNPFNSALISDLTNSTTCVYNGSGSLIWPPPAPPSFSNPYCTPSHLNSLTLLISSVYKSLFSQLLSFLIYTNRPGAPPPSHLAHLEPTRSGHCASFVFSTLRTLWPPSNSVTLF